MSNSATDVDLREATLQGLRLKRKELPTLWLYDVRGSQLYEKVTQLPEYYLPGASARSCPRTPPRSPR